MKTINLIKRWVLTSLMFIGMSLGVYAQKQSKQDNELKGPWNLLIPAYDTVIMQGTEIEIGSYLNEKKMPEIEILGFGKSKKSDIKKGYYTIKQKPKKTITYELIWYWPSKNLRHIEQRTIYVAKTEEEKKQMEAITEKKKQEEKITRIFTPYYPNKKK